MTKSNQPSRYLSRSVKQIYKNFFQRYLEKIGINKKVSDIYNYIAYRVRGPYIHQSKYKNEEINFYITSPQERNRANSLKRVLLDQIFEEIRPGDVFFDIGAGIGTLSCTVGSHISDGQVYAFEPLPPNVESIKRNVEHNTANVDVFQCALSDTNGNIALNVPEESVDAGYTNAAILPEHTTSNFWEDKTEEISVRSRVGDQFIKENSIPVPNIISIDVEGAELSVIRGLKDTLSQDACRVVFCEVHEYLLNDFGASSDELEDLLRQLGFRIKIFDERTYEEDGESKSLYRLAAYKRPS